MRNCCDVGGGLVAAIGGQKTIFVYLCLISECLEMITDAAA